MLPRPCGILSFRTLRVAWLAGIFLLLPIDLLAEQHQIVCRESLSQARRDELATKLRKITGWSDLRFDRRGTLRLGNTEPVSGSQRAREFLARVNLGTRVVVLEDASKRTDVAFSRVIPGRWKQAAPDDPPAFVVQIDFSDFEHVIGDPRALQAFDVGWALLHELDHIVNDSHDATSPDEAGECEDHINQMRRECDLPQRVDYFFTFLPLAKDTAFVTRLVRLAIEHEQVAPGKKKRYWVVWDAKLVGGLDGQKQIAALR